MLRARAVQSGALFRPLMPVCVARHPDRGPTDEEKARHYLWRFWRHIPWQAIRPFMIEVGMVGYSLEQVEGFAKGP